MATGRVQRGWMGLEANERIQRSGERRVYCRKWQAPADLAGLRKGDHLLAIHSAVINSLLDLPSALFPIRENEIVRVRIRRADKDIDFNVKTIAAPFDATDRLESGSQHAGLIAH